ncbi:MAG TPA: hypothetical protein VKY59_01725 [Spirillospora sp.]|nr:hypothetical protein [Spirillospora sp.]
MNEGLLLILALCAVVLVGLGLLALLVFGVLRWQAPKLLKILGGAGAVFASEEPANKVDARLNRRRRANLRNRAESLDFDAALARHRSGDFRPQGQASSANPAGQRTNHRVQPAESPFGDTPPPLRRRRRERNQDEIFGGMLDEDGDGDLDF